MDRIPEMEPLEAGRYYPPLRQRSHVTSSCYRAPLRVCRLLLLLVMLPSAFLLLPLYMRYHVFSSQMYPMGMSDMRLIDGKVSPTWCQRQVVKSNATFNAFVVPGDPEFSSQLVPVSMTRQISLKADMKEYWGFYLLRGSTVTVSACVRRPGASLIMIRGYKHLQDCAYIGDDSSEEVDELIKAEEMGLLSKDDLVQKLALMKKEDGKANQPGTMKRHKAGVSFHDPSQAMNMTSEDTASFVDIDHDPQELRSILDHLHAARQAIKKKAAREFRLPSHLVAVESMHRFRDTNVDRVERQWLTFKDLDNRTRSGDFDIDKDQQHTVNDTRRTLNKSSSYEYIDKPISDVLSEKQNHSKISDAINNSSSRFMKEKWNKIELKTINDKLDDNKVVLNEISSDIRSKNVEAISAVTNKIELKEINVINTDLRPNSIDNDKTQEVFKEIELEANTQSLLDTNTESDPDSKEIFEDVLRRLQSLGDRGKRVLKKLQLSMGINNEESTNLLDDTMTKVVGSSEELDRLRRVLVEAIDEERTRAKTVKEGGRDKRELYLGAKTLEQMFNDDDGARDFAAEEGLEPDGYADHHTRLNETSPLDMSNSEFWSSFSSSEEALLECEGLILNLPLTPHIKCEERFSEAEQFEAAQRNAITYRVPANGYYFFVFNSENEIDVNHISVRFDLHKTRYEVARAALRECTNSTRRCDLQLDIFTAQKVVLELPLRNNDSLWNEQYLVISECEPRTSVYIVCALIVPILFMVFAFQ